MSAQPAQPLRAGHKAEGSHLKPGGFVRNGLPIGTIEGSSAPPNN